MLSPETEAAPVSTNFGIDSQGTEGARDVVYSPDGDWIAYSIGTELFKRPLVGGSPIRIAEDAPSTAGLVGLSWLDDGTILYEQFGTGEGVSTRRIARISEDGGAPLNVVFGASEQEVSITWVHGLPGARGALVVACPGVGCTLDTNQLHIVDLEDLSSEVLFSGVARAWYVPTGHIVYVRADGAVLAQPFDITALQLAGSSVPLLEGVRTANLGNSGMADMVLGSDGTLLYVEGSASASLNEFVWVTRSGQATPVDPGYAFAPTVGNYGWRLSPDETKIVFNSIVDGNIDVRIKQLPDGPEERITFSEDPDVRPFWMPDGQSVTYFSASNIWSRRADGTGDAVLILDDERGVTQGSWSSDGEWLVFRSAATASEGLGLRDILGFCPGVDSSAVSLVASAEFAEQGPALSPDGRWLAYSSNETGRDEVFIRPFPNVDSTRVRVSTDGGFEPLWAKSGDELFFVDDERRLLSARFDPASGQARTPEMLFTIPIGYPVGPSNYFYDVSSDGERFLMVRPFGGCAEEGAAEPQRLILVQNFFEELRQVVPDQ